MFKHLLLSLHRVANILSMSESCFVLEKKIISQLNQATLNGLLISRYLYLHETLYDNWTCLSSIRIEMIWFEFGSS